jgi:hypothetical protein
MDFPSTSERLEMESDQLLEKHYDDEIKEKLGRIKSLEEAKATIEKEIELYRTDILEIMKDMGYKSKDFDLAKVTLSDDVKYNALWTVEKIENEVGEDYIKRTIDRSKLQKEIPSVHDKAFEKEIKGTKLMIKMK